MDSRWVIQDGKYYFEGAVVAISHRDATDNLHGLDYSRYCVFVDKVILPKPTTKRKFSWDRPLRRKLPLSTKQFCHKLSRYNEQGFNDMPKWLRDEFLMRVTYLKPRQPTDIEQWETNSDAKEHRIVNKEMNIDDYHAMYVKGKAHGYTTIT